MTDTESHEGDGLLSLAKALASNNQENENADLMEWLKTATVHDLRLAFPVLLMWCRNSAKKAAKAKKEDKSEPNAETVAQKIVSVLEEAIDSDEATADVSSLRMGLAGYLHTNHEKMRKFPTIANLEKRTKEKIAKDRSATNTLNMVNLAAPNPASISQYITPEEEERTSKGWGIPTLNIDLGLGLAGTSPADVCEEFIKDNKPLRHPFTGETVGKMKVRKVIPSKRKPVWIEYYAPDESRLLPDVLAKQGDDLRNDASVSTVSKLCESIFAKAPIKWALGTPPTVCAYNVLVTAGDAGYLEMVPGKNFLDLSAKLSKDERDSIRDSAISSTSTVSTASIGKTGWGNVDIHKLAPGLVGSYISNFILGVRDRHEDNMMVVGDIQDNPRMMQIDFGYVLMEYPGGVHLDMPRLTMPVPLVDRYMAEPGRGTESGEPTTLMDDLQHDMLAAYLVLRRHSHQIIPFCSHLMSSSFSYKYVESVLKGHHVFRTDRSEHHVIKWISQKLTAQWAHFHFRRELKLGMVSGYYKFVELTTFEKKPGDEGPMAALRERFSSFFLGAKADSKEEDDHFVMTDREIDFVELDDRVNNAMKLQKEVSRLMVAEKETHGALEVKDCGSDGAASDDSERGL